MDSDHLQSPKSGEDDWIDDTNEPGEEFDAKQLNEEQQDQLPEEKLSGFVYADDDEDEEEEEEEEEEEKEEEGEEERESLGLEPEQMSVHELDETVNDAVPDIGEASVDNKSGSEADIDMDPLGDLTGIYSDSDEMDETDDRDAKDIDEEARRIMHEMENEDATQARKRPASDSKPKPMLLRIPKIDTDVNCDMHFVKLPIFLNIEPSPFNAETYKNEVSGDPSNMDENERMRLKLKIENTLRWRNVSDEVSENKRQSNSRFVKWSDGSLSFHIGREVYDVYKTNIVGDHNHLFIRNRGTLYGRSLFRTKLTFRPHATDTSAHTKMTLSLGRKLAQSQQKIRILTNAGLNPDINRIEMIKQETKRLKKEERRQTLIERRKEQQLARNRQITKKYLEEKDAGSSEEYADSEDSNGNEKSDDNQDSDNQVSDDDDDVDDGKESNESGEEDGSGQDDSHEDSGDKNQGARRVPAKIAETSDEE